MVLTENDKLFKMVSEVEPGITLEEANKIFKKKPRKPMSAEEYTEVVNSLSDENLEKIIKFTTLLLKNKYPA